MNSGISKRIKILRKTKEINQEELGKILNISRRSVSAIENGETDLSTKQLEKLSEFFNVSTDYLIKGKEEENTINTTEQEILMLVRNDLDIKKTLLNVLETKKKAIQQMMMKTQNELMTA